MFAYLSGFVSACALFVPGRSTPAVAVAIAFVLIIAHIKVRDRENWKHQSKRSELEAEIVRLRER